MASIVEKKFNWFEQHLRENLKERTVASELYQGISEAETDSFMVFYLKILLDKLDLDKSKSVLNVPDTDRAEPRLGYRTSVPVPKGGISAIKVGNVPKLDLDEFIAKTLTQAIKDYLGAVTRSPELSKQLLETTNLEDVSREELNNLKIPTKKSTLVLRNYFHLENYLNEQNMKFINSTIIQNAESLHHNCVYSPSNPALGFKRIFPDIQNSSDLFVNPLDWLSVRMGIIQLGTNPDIPKDVPLLSKFRSGNAAQFVVKAFSLSPVVEAVEAFKAYIEDYNELFSSKDEQAIKDELAETPEEPSELMTRTIDLANLCSALLTIFNFSAIDPLIYGTELNTYSVTIKTALENIKNESGSFSDNVDLIIANLENFLSIESEIVLEINTTQLVRYSYMFINSANYMAMEYKGTIICYLKD